MNRKIELARHALRAAMQLRRNLPLPREAAVNAFDVAKMAGLDVRFLDAPSLEGMLVRDPGLRIILPSLEHRPRGRVLFSCAHELGHQQFGHGTRVDLYIDGPRDGAMDEEEFLADAFAGHLLMPRAAVLDAFSRRSCEPQTATFRQLFVIAGELGVGYDTLLTHLSVSLDLITRQERDRLGKISPKEMKADLCGRCDERSVVVADRDWKWVSVDSERDDLVAVPNDTPPPEALLRHEFDREGFSFFRAVGVGEASLTLNGRRVPLRVSRRHYVGPYINRYLPDPDEC